MPKKRKDDPKAARKDQIGKLLDRYSGSLQSGGQLRKQVEQLRQEWRR
jgi:hypothetical protein